MIPTFKFYTVHEPDKYGATMSFQTITGARRYAERNAKKYHTMYMVCGHQTDASKPEFLESHRYEFNTGYTSFNIQCRIGVHIPLVGG